MKLPEIPQNNVTVKSDADIYEELLVSTINEVLPLLANDNEEGSACIYYDWIGPKLDTRWFVNSDVVLPTNDKSLTRKVAFACARLFSEKGYVVYRTCNSGDCAILISKSRNIHFGSRTSYERFY